MPSNKNALIRYKTLDKCLRERYGRYTIEDLIDACSKALYEATGVPNISERTIRDDLHTMRSEILGYNAPIEVYDKKYYRYSNREYSIMNMPMSQNDLDIMQEAVSLLRELEGFAQFSEMADVISRLQDKLSISSQKRKPIIHFDSTPQLKGLHWLSEIYEYIMSRRTLSISYQSFNEDEPTQQTYYPHLLKEFRNRWFLFASRAEDMSLWTLALDRIVDIVPLQENYHDNPLFDAENFFSNVIGVSKRLEDKAEIVTFWADSRTRRYIETKPIHTSQLLLSSNSQDGSAIFQIEVIVNYEMYSTFMSYTSGLRLLSPEPVASHMCKLIERMGKEYITDRRR